MTTDFRALCAELADELATCWPSTFDMPDCLNRARAALAEPAHFPDSKKMVEPDDGEMAELVAELIRTANNLDDDWYHGSARVARHAADLLSRLAPQPVPEGPSDKELMLTYVYAVQAAIDTRRGPINNEHAEVAQVAGLRAVLARWGRT